MENNEPQLPAIVKPSGSTIQRRMVSWVGGMPVPTSVPLVTKPALEELASVAMSLPYVPTPPKDLVPDTPKWTAWELAEREFEGMTNAEVILIKMARSAASGDQGAATALLDRILGRPKQSVESKSFTMSYTDVLKEKAERMKDVSPSQSMPSESQGELDGLF